MDHNSKKIMEHPLQISPIVAEETLSNLSNLLVVGGKYLLVTLGEYWGVVISLLWI